MRLALVFGGDARTLGGGSSINASGVCTSDKGYLSGVFTSLKLRLCVPRVWLGCQAVVYSRISRLQGRRVAISAPAPGLTIMSDRTTGGPSHEPSPTFILHLVGSRPAARRLRSHQYGQVILLFTVLRLLDCVLAPRREKMLAEHKKR